MHWLTGWGITLYRSWRVQKRIYGGDGVRFTSASTAQGRPAPGGTAACRSGPSSERFKSPTGRTTSREATLSSVHTDTSSKGAADAKRATRHSYGQANRSTGTEAASCRRGCREDRARVRPSRSRSTGPPRHRLFRHQCRVLRPLLRLFGPRAPTAKLRAAPRRLRRQAQRLRKARANRIRLFPNGR